MLKNSSSRNQRLKGVKVNLAFRTFLVLAVGLWMIYQLRLFHSHKIASENGGLVKEQVIGSVQLKLGRKGLVMPDGDRSESYEKVERKREDKNETEKDTEEQDEIEQVEYLVDGVEKGGDDEDEGLEMEPLDDSLEENDDDDDENVNRIERKTGGDDSSKKLKMDATERMY